MAHPRSNRMLVPQGIAYFLGGVAFLYLVALWQMTSLLHQQDLPCSHEPQGRSLTRPLVEKLTVPKNIDNTSLNYNFTTAICACVKDGEAYLQEWIDYHLLAMKLDAIYLYDHSRDFELERWYENTRHHSVYHKVHIIHYKDTGEYYDEKKGEYIQNLIYTDCVDHYGKEGPRHDYFAFIDVDEFLVIQDERYADIRGVLQHYLVPFGGALTVNWALFGTSNKTVYAPLPVTFRFQYRLNQTHNVVKTIAKTTDYLQHRNPHAVSLKHNAKVHTTKHPGALHKEAKGETGASDHDRPSKILLLYHYRYTSMKEYIYKKCARGNIDVGTSWCDADGKSLRKDTPDHIQPQVGDVFDDTAWRFLTARLPKYQMFEEWEDFT